MPDYEYNKDFPFAAFITNLGKYNEGELVGEWVRFPTTPEKLKEVFERIGIGSRDAFGAPYEEWFITDYDCYVGGLYDKLGEYENLDELNYLASRLEELDRSEYNQFLAAMEVGDHTGSLQEIINLTENLDCYDVYPDIEDYDDLGRYYIDELDAMQIPEHLQNYIDYEAYGRDVALEEGGEFTEFGYVRDTGDRFDEVYDGDRDSIPEEYRVMNFRDNEDELTADDKWDMSTDLAFDLDEFFRQQDPQYAAEHPDEHEAKEDICDNLMDGKIAAVERRLAELAQDGDPLPARLAEYKELTGYDETLDADAWTVGEPIQEQESSHLEDMVSAAVKAEQEYAAEAAAFVQTPESILEQVREVYGDQTSVSAPVPDEKLTGESIRTPRGSFHVTDMSRQEMAAAGYGLHHTSDDGKYLIMGNGTRAFAIVNEQAQEKDNPLRTAEMTLEDDYGMIDGIINNGRRGEEQEKAKEAAEKTQPAQKPSIKERLAEAKKESAQRHAQAKEAPQKKPPELGEI